MIYTMKDCTGMKQPVVIYTIYFISLLPLLIGVHWQPSSTLTGVIMVSFLYVKQNEPILVIRSAAKLIAKFHYTQM